MAQPTVTQRPATWAGTSAPILYKLTSTNYANAGYRLQVEVWDATAAAKIADAKYYANSSGVVTVNISSLLSASMNLNNSSDLTTSDSVYVDSNWIKYYIKYREVWTASSETQVNDSANTRYAIYGGLQIGSINDFANYIPGDLTKLFLNLGGAITQGYPFTISAIGSTLTGVKIDKYLDSVFVESSGGLLEEGKVSRMKVNETAYDRIDFTIVDASAETYSNGRAVGAGFPFDSVTLGHAESVAVAAGDFNAINRAYSGTQNVVISLLINVISSDLSGDVTLNFILYNAAKSLSVNIIPIPITANGVYVVNKASTTFAPAFIEIILDNGSAGAVTWELDVLESVASETKSYTVSDQCSNTIMLQWKNSLGGDECFPFTCNQDYSWHYSDRKAKRLTLFADNLTLSQWEAIQGLNTIGELYKTPITEFTTSVNRTMATIGQSVYVLNSDGSKIGVNVIGGVNSTQTKQKTHSATVIIEYPELFLQ